MIEVGTDDKDDERVRLHSENLRLKFEEARANALLGFNHQLRRDIANLQTENEELRRQVRRSNEEIARLNNEAKEHRSFKRLVDRSVLISQETYERLKYGKV